MRNWKKLLAALLFFALLVGCGLLARQAVALLDTHCIARVSFAGANSLFQDPYEYYALDENSATQVPRALIDLFHGKAMEREIYADTDTSYWFVELEYAPDGKSFTDADALSSGFGPKYRVVYSKWTLQSGEPDIDDLAVMRRMTEALHDGDPADWVWEGTGSRGLTNFLLIRHEDHYLLQHEDTTLFALSAEGQLTELMAVPEGGTFDSYFFP